MSQISREQWENWVRGCGQRPKKAAYEPFCRLLSDLIEQSDWNANEIAYAIATAAHETGWTFLPITERGARSYFRKYEPNTQIGQNLGNTQPGDGYLFRGRGYVQLTGRINYRKFGIENSPDDALQHATALRIMIEGMTRGDFTGRRLSQYFRNKTKTPGWVNARQVINGLDRAADIAGYAISFRVLLAVEDRRNQNATKTVAPSPAAWTVTTTTTSPVLTIPDPAPTPTDADQPPPAEPHKPLTETLADKLTVVENLGTKADAVSRSSTLMTASTYLLGILGAIGSWVQDNPVLTVGAIVLILGAVWYWHGAQTRATTRGMMIGNGGK